MLTTQDFSYNGAVVRVRRANKGVDAFDSAVYKHKLRPVHDYDWDDDRDDD